MLPWETVEGEKIVMNATAFVELLFALNTYNKGQNSLSSAGGSSSAGSSGSSSGSSDNIDFTLALKYEKIIQELTKVPHLSDAKQPVNPPRAYIRVPAPIDTHNNLRGETFLSYLQGDL